MKSKEFSPHKSHPSITPELTTTHGDQRDDDEIYTNRSILDWTGPYAAKKLPEVVYDSNGVVDINASQKRAEANEAPYPATEEANTERYRDTEEITLINKRLAEIGEPSKLNRKLLREKAELEARLNQIGYYGDAAENTAKFYEHNKDALHTNALAEAARRGIEINTEESKEDQAA